MPWSVVQHWPGRFLSLCAGKTFGILFGGCLKDNSMVMPNLPQKNRSIVHECVTSGVHDIPSFFAVTLGQRVSTGRGAFCCGPFLAVVYWQEEGGEIVDILSTIVVLIPSVLSLCVSGIYAYIALKKTKEPQKDEIWETTIKLLCSRNQDYIDTDEFVRVYEELWLFKNHPEKMAGYVSIGAALEDYKKQSISKVDKAHGQDAET